jgi:hypothetical protein
LRLANLFKNRLPGVGQPPFDVGIRTKLRELNPHFLFHLAFLQEIKRDEPPIDLFLQLFGRLVGYSWYFLHLLVLLMHAALRQISLEFERQVTRDGRGIRRRNIYKGAFKEIRKLFFSEAFGALNDDLGYLVRRPCDDFCHFLRLAFVSGQTLLSFPCLLVGNASRVIERGTENAQQRHRLLNLC